MAAYVQSLTLQVSTQICALAGGSKLVRAVSVMQCSALNTMAANGSIRAVIDAAGIPLSLVN
jgi:hypothetical protein